MLGQLKQNDNKKMVVQKCMLLPNIRFSKLCLCGIFLTATWLSHDQLLATLEGQPH